MRTTRDWLLGLLLATTAVAAAQAPSVTAPKAPAPKPRYGGVNFSTTVGSFKMLGPGTVPVQGDLTFQFRGTVLLSSLSKNSVLSISPGVQLEYEDVKAGKRVYHGTGTITLKNFEAKSVQFFGKDLKARFYGQAIIRLYGEFDRNLKTGIYQYEGDEEVRAWGTGGMTLILPTQEQAMPKPRVRKSSGQ